MRSLKRYGIISAFIIVTLLAASMTMAGQKQHVRPTAKDKCPVCGMFVAKYPDFIAGIKYKYGAYAFFDGTKDMFKYLFNLKKYHPSQDKESIEAVYVTDYYSLNFVDGYTAYYVIGSDVYGPMGNEFIPFGNEADAKGFMKDHHGKSVMRFKDVKVETVKALD